MDDIPGPRQRPGGSVEPVDRGFRAPETAPPAAAAAERFELRDPREELTYRGKTFVEMVTRANQIGASRFTAIAADGTRSTVSKTDGTWRRDDLPPPETVRRVEQPASPAIPLHKNSAQAEPAKAQDEAKAEQAARVAQIEAALNERYLIRRAPLRIGEVTIGQTEYRQRGDTSKVAFTESTFRLSTDNNNPSVARSMVDVAEARGWQAIRVSGNDDFRRMVWLESSLRGVKTLGYEPLPGDQELLRRERDARQVNRIEPLPRANAAASLPAKASERGTGGRKAVLAALEAVLVAKNVSARQRDAVMATAADNLARRLLKGETHQVKVYDKAAPSRRAVATPTREVQRDRERGSPAR